MRITVRDPRHHVQVAQQFADFLVAQSSLHAGWRRHAGNRPESDLRRGTDEVCASVASSGTEEVNDDTDDHPDTRQGGDPQTCGAVEKVFELTERIASSHWTLLRNGD